MKKILILFLFLTTSTTLAYSINYIMNTTVQHDIEVGNTVQSVNGLSIDIIDKEAGNLTYYALDETSEDKYTLTYTYNYEIIAVGTYDILVTSLSDDIIIVNYTVCDTITIEFALNQDIEYVNGEMINVSFYFELVEYTVENPFVVTTASIKQLANFFPTLTEQVILEMYNLTETITSLTNYYAYTSLQEYDLDDYFQYQISGILVFYE